LVDFVPTEFGFELGRGFVAERRVQALETHVSLAKKTRKGRPPQPTRRNSRPAASTRSSRKPSWC